MDGWLTFPANMGGRARGEAVCVVSGGYLPSLHCTADPLTVFNKIYHVILNLDTYFYLRDLSIRAVEIYFIRTWLNLGRDVK